MNSNNKSKYGEILTRIIKEKKMTQEYFYNKLGIAKPYFYDIIRGKINPPPPETQIKILKILNPLKEDREKLLDIAAKERNELPIDIMMYFENNTEIISKIREDNKYKKVIEMIVSKGENNYE